jgi:hypothetical protein
VRTFLAILVLELEDMVDRLVRPPKLASVHGYRWPYSEMGGVGARDQRCGLPAPARWQRLYRGRQ